MLAITAATIAKADLTVSVTLDETAIGEWSDEYEARYEDIIKGWEDLCNDIAEFTEEVKTQASDLIQ